MRTQTVAIASIVLLLGILSSPILAGPLATHPGAFFDGSVTWAGSTDFDDDGDTGVLEGNGLEGSVDWAVFTKSAFDTAFPASGYSPPADELAYTFQVNVGGNAAATLLSVALDPLQPVGTIGSFSGGGVSGNAPTSAPSFSGTSADFSFAGASILVGDSSEGLVFSSPHLPMDFFGSVVDGGSFAFVIPLPSPSAVPIPEPATGLLAALGILLLDLMRLARRHPRE